MPREQPRLGRRSVLGTIAGGLGLTAGVVGAAASSTLDVQTDGAAEITSDAATLTLTVNETGDNYSLWSYFEYGESGTLDSESSGEWVRDGESWSVEISDLDPNTTYDFRAVAEGDTDTVRGSTMRFTTPDPNPTVSVSLDTPEDISHGSASLWGDLDEVIDVEAVDVSYEYREQGTSTWNTTRTERLADTAFVRHYVDGLSMGTTYEYRLTASATDATASDTTSIGTFTTDSERTTKGSTGSATDVTDTTATLTGTVDDLGDNADVDISFRWGPPAPSGDFPPNATSELTVSSTGEYGIDVSGLDPSTTYEYWFTVDYHTSGKREFTTAGPQLSVKTGFPETNSDTSITFDGDLEGMGEASSVDVVFQYRQASSDTWSETAGQTLSSPGTFSATVDDLAEDTDFEFRAVASASDGDTDTGEVTGADTSGDPAVTTKDAQNVTETSVTLVGSLDDTGGAGGELFFEWGPEGSLTNTATPDSFDQFSNDQFADISGLSSGTTYEYRVVYDADDGEIARGAVESVTTESGPGLAIDSFAATDGGTGGPHAAIDVDWGVSASNGELDTVTVEVIDGSVVDSTTTTVSGSSAAGSDSFEIKHGAGTTYEVTLTVTAADGTTKSASGTVTPS